MPGTRRHNPLKVMYTGALADLSGYAAAAREYVLSLDAVGVDVIGDIRSFEPWRPRRLIEEVVGRRLNSIVSKGGSAPIHIIHLTPDQYQEYNPSPRYKIGYFAWETSRLPGHWVKSINQNVAETWVPCEYLRDVSIQSGVTVPVRVLPHAIPVPPESFKPDCEFRGLPSDLFKFYSIFQWSERKNGKSLVRAYYEEFSKNDPVILVLKTYRVGNNPSERDLVRRNISQIKRETKGAMAPPILLIEEFLGPNDLLSLHLNCDCYVSMARSEGFGIPAFEAAACGRGVIVPNYSAFAEHFTGETGWLIDVPEEVPVANMKHISVLYTGDMAWGDPSIESCRANMRDAFENRAFLDAKGKAARQYVLDNLSHRAIGRMMKGWLELIQGRISG